MPKTKGSVIPATAIPRATFPVRRRDLGSSSSPTKKRKKIRPRLASVSRTGRLLAGKTACRKALLRPRTDGPSSIPP